MSKSQNAQQLFANAVKQGDVSKAAAQIFVAPNIAAAINRGLCPDVDKLEVSEPYLTNMILDDSSSIEQGAITDVLIEGANHYRAELLRSNAADDILLNLTAMTGGVIYPFGYLQDAPVISRANYDPVHGTPLYDSIIMGAGTLKAEWLRQKSLGNAGARGMLVLATDGFDEHSKHDEAAARTALEEIYTNEHLLVMFIGIRNPRWEKAFKMTFREVAIDKLGIPEKMVLLPDATGKAIREAFQVASRASKTASQGAKSFSQVAQGGLTQIV